MTLGRAWQEQIKELRSEIVRLQAAKRAALKVADERSNENVALRQALSWYADKANYDTGQDCEDVLIDGGATARRALEQTPFYASGGETHSGHSDDCPRCNAEQTVREKEE